MSPQLNITTGEASGTGGVPTGTGPAFVASLFDAGPPPSAGVPYVKCQSLTDVVNNFGPRSSTSATAYDWLDEFFQDGGQIAWVTRVTDNTATSAALTLNDEGPHPTVVVTALTPGTEGNNTYIDVQTGTSPTFTASTTSASTSITAVSSFANIGVGTLVTGTGIPAATYIVSVNVTAGTAVLSQAATATGTGVIITPGTFTVEVQAEDGSGNVLADELHGPYYTTSQLFADTTSTWVSFAQSAGSGFTTNIPAALGSTSSPTALTGGADASDLTDNSHVAALANFPPSLGVGTVALPGKTSVTCWQGIQAHVNANNRWGVLDMADAATSSAANTQVIGKGTGDWSRCFFIQGSLTLPALPGGSKRTVPGSAGVAALRAQVAATSNQATAPAGRNWGLDYPLGFTKFFGPAPPAAVAGNFSQADVNSMEANGINCFANFYGTLCLFGFVSPVPSSQDPVYDQASAATERMALVNDLQAAMADYLFDPITTATIEQLQNDLNAVCLNHYSGGALYDGGSGQASDAFLVQTAAPINTTVTAQAKQLNAQVTARIIRYADTVNTTVTVIPVTVSLPTAAA